MPAERVVGFLMYDAGEPDDEPREASIYRFMIDREHQGKGYGRAALAKALDEIRAIPGVRKISISYMPDNPAAKPFYAQLRLRGSRRGRRRRDDRGTDAVSSDLMRKRSTHRFSATSTPSRRPGC